MSFCNVSKLEIVHSTKCFNYSNGTERKGMVKFAIHWWWRMENKPFQQHPGRLSEMGLSGDLVALLSYRTTRSIVTEKAACLTGPVRNVDGMLLLCHGAVWKERIVGRAVKTKARLVALNGLTAKHSHRTGSANEILILVIVLGCPLNPVREATLPRSLLRK